MSTWEVGQQVAKIPHHGDGITGPFTIETISGKRPKIVLSDGSAWGQDGRQWGRASERWYTGARISAWSEQHAARGDAYKRRRVASNLADLIRGADLTWGQLSAIKVACRSTEPEPGGSPQ